MLDKDSILAVLRQRGPSLPVHIKRVVGVGDTFIIGAMLAELKDLGKVKVTSTKRGGSPFYYVPEHSARLVNLLPDLGEKERRTAELLRAKNVLQDKLQDPIVRVTLRAIKDFAVPVEVKLKDGIELFWKWYLTPNSEVEVLIKRILGFDRESVRKDSAKAAAPVKRSEPTPDISASRSSDGSGLQKVEPVSARGSDQKSSVSVLKRVDDSGDEFLKRLLAFFSEKKIQVVSKNVVRKNSDVEFELLIPSAVGVIEYFCKAKAKKKCNDGDLSAAYLQGQSKRLPVLFLTTGKVTKKAKDKLKTDFKGLVLKEL